MTFAIYQSTDNKSVKFWCVRSCLNNWSTRAFIVDISCMPVKRKALNHNKIDRKKSCWIKCSTTVPIYYLQIE